MFNKNPVKIYTNTKRKIRKIKRIIKPMLFAFPVVVVIIINLCGNAIMSNYKYEINILKKQLKFSLTFISPTHYIRACISWKMEYPKPNILDTISKNIKSKNSIITIETTVSTALATVRDML